MGPKGTGSPKACTEGGKCSLLRKQADFKDRMCFGSLPMEIRVQAEGLGYGRRTRRPTTCSGKGEREGLRQGTGSVLDQGSAWKEDAEVRGGA